MDIQPYERDEDLLSAARADGRARARVYRFPAAAVVLGRGSRPEEELHLDRLRADRVPLLRRRGGGCAVVLDPGNVIVSVTVPAPGLRLAGHFASLSEWLIRGLTASGAPGVIRRGTSDLAVGDRKIGGACIYRTRDLLFYTVSLLVEPEIALMARYLAHPPREPAYRRGRRHAEFVTRLRDHCGLDADTLAGRLPETLDRLPDCHGWAGPP